MVDLIFCILILYEIMAKADPLKDPNSIFNLASKIGKQIKFKLHKINKIYS